MKRALISPDERSGNGTRIAQVVAKPDEFEVAPPLFFVDVADNVTSEGFFWDGTQPQPIPAPTTLPINPDKQDAVTKAQTLATSGSTADLKAFAAAIAKVI